MTPLRGSRSVASRHAALVARGRGGAQPRGRSRRRWCACWESPEPATRRRSRPRSGAPTSRPSAKRCARSPGSPRRAPASSAPWTNEAMAVERRGQGALAPALRRGGCWVCLREDFVLRQMQVADAPLGAAGSAQGCGRCHARATPLPSGARHGAGRPACPCPPRPPMSTRPRAVADRPSHTDPLALLKGLVSRGVLPACLRPPGDRASWARSTAPSNCTCVTRRGWLDVIRHAHLDGVSFRNEATRRPGPQQLTDLIDVHHPGGLAARAARARRIPVAAEGRAVGRRRRRAAARARDPTRQPWPPRSARHALARRALARCAGRPDRS